MNSGNYSVAKEVEKHGYESMREFKSQKSEVKS